MLERRDIGNGRRMVCCGEHSLDQLDSNHTMYFAVNMHRRILVPGGVMEMDRGEFARRLSRNLVELKREVGKTAFRVSPRNKNEMEINRALWRMVHEGCADIDAMGDLFSSNIFCVSIPVELQAFLQNVTLVELDTVVFDFMRLLKYQLDEEGDDESVERLKSEVMPDIWERVENSNEATCEGEPTDLRRRDVLECLVQISFITPWKIDVNVWKLRPREMELLLNEKPYCASFRRELTDGKVHACLFADWLRYEDLLFRSLQLPRGAVASALLHNIRSGTAHKSWLAAKTVMLCAGRSQKGNLLNALPIEVVREKIAPFVLLGDASVHEAIPVGEVEGQPRAAVVSSVGCKSAAPTS